MHIIKRDLWAALKIERDPNEKVLKPPHVAGVQFRLAGGDLVRITACPSSYSSMLDYADADIPL